MELYGRIKPCTAACAPSSIVQRSIAETISLKSNFAVVWEALQLYERRVTVLKKPGWYGASNQQAIYGALMRTYIHSACYDGAQSMANSITSIFSFLVQVIAIYIVLFLLLFRFVQAFLLKLYHRRKLNYQIWDMDKRS